MRVLMIGLGSIGQRHLRNLKRIYGENLDIFAYRTRRLQQTFSDNMQIREGVRLEEEFGIKVYTNLDEALKCKPDIAYVTNITSKHMETAIKCAESGCDLFIEKPLSNSLEGIRKLEKVASEKQVIIFMGFQNRYHVCIQEAKLILEKGDIGALQSVYCEFSERLTTMHTYEDYRQTYMAKVSMGGGPVLNLQIHDLDLLHYLFGEPISVFSVMTSNSHLEVDVEDGASSIFTFKNSNGDIFPVFTHTDFLQFPPVHYFKIVGEKGRIEVDLNNAFLRLIVDGEIIKEINYEKFQRNDMFIDEMKDFISCVQKKKKPNIDLNQGIISLKMAVAAKMSASENSVIIMEDISNE